MIRLPLQVGSIIGFLIVIGCVLGGFALGGGPFPVLLQPNELLVIGGAAAGTMVIMAPGSVGRRVTRALKHAFGGKLPSKADYLELLRLLFNLFQVMRRDGILALEEHLTEPAKSPIFKKYPGVLGHHHAVSFLVEGLRHMADGCSPEDLSLLFDADLETFHAEEHEPIGLIRTTSDALPGLGIVAAVLGIVITMGHLDAGPETIGHHVAAALVGTFLGILLCYGVLGPLATRLEMQGAAQQRFVLCIKDGLLAAARGSNPQLSVEFARRAIFSDERPSMQELEKAVKG